VLADSALACIHWAKAAFELSSAFGLPGRLIGAVRRPRLGAAGTRRITPSRGLAGVLMSDTFRADWFS